MLHDSLKSLIVNHWIYSWVKKSLDSHIFPWKVLSLSDTKVQNCTFCGHFGQWNDLYVDQMVEPKQEQDQGMPREMLLTQSNNSIKFPSIYQKDQRQACFGSCFVF